MPVSKFHFKFDAIPLHKERVSSRYDALSYRINRQAIPGRPDIRSRQAERWSNRFHSLGIGARLQVLVNRFDIFSLQNSRERNRYDVISPVGAERIVSSYDSLRSSFERITNRFQIYSDYVAGNRYGRLPARFHIENSARSFLPIRFDVMPQDFRTFFCDRFDSIGLRQDRYPARKQAVVKPGWRILAKNILSNEIHDLGFIDADSTNHALEGVFLPSEKSFDW